MRLTCAGGHLMAPNQRFCPECGAAGEAIPASTTEPPSHGTPAPAAHPARRPAWLVPVLVGALVLVTGLATALVLGPGRGGESVTYREGFRDGQQLSDAVRRTGDSPDVICQRTFEIGIAQNPGQDESEYVEGCLAGIDAGR